MNVLMLSLMYPEDMKTQVARDAKDKLQNQINSYQRAFVEGIKSNLLPDERLEIVNALPVGVFPLQYRRLLIPSGWHDGHAMYELGCINLPGIKQYGRARRAARKLSAWCAQDPSNRMVLLYTMYLPYLQAVERVRRRYPDLKACVIVTDLPNELDWRRAGRACSGKSSTNADAGAWNFAARWMLLCCSPDLWRMRWA